MSAAAISQILSNFKLFSENDKRNPFQITDSSHKYTLKFQITVGILAIIIFGLVYFKRVELIAALSGVFGDMLTTAWLNTHLTSAGELASTYVPSDFAVLSDNNDA
jgi:hypothetical protein